MAEPEPAIAAAPLDPAGFRAAWLRLGAPRRLLLAVSGGSDSMAMMRLAAPLGAAGDADLHVATVDHGLRAASAGEAEFVGGAALELGLPHAILRWTGDKPKSGLQSAARTARYGLLIERATYIGVDAVITAHTADDQAETVFMRLKRGSGARGLAGMAEDSLIAAGASAPVRLLRPLLAVRRRSLRGLTPQDRGDFFDDPSNDDPAFERVRVRSLLAELEAAGELTAEALIATADACRIAAKRQARLEERSFVERHGGFDPYGGVSLSSDLEPKEDSALAARLIHAVTGADYAPAEDKVEAALRTVLAGHQATIAGAILFLDGERLCFCREPAAVLGRAGLASIAPMILAPRESVLWDNRFIVRNSTGAPAVLRPLGPDAGRLADSAADARSLVTSPGLWNGHDLAAFPGAEGDFAALAAERFYRRVNRFHWNYEFVNRGRGAGLP